MAGMPPTMQFNMKLGHVPKELGRVVKGELSSAINIGVEKGATRGISEGRQKELEGAKSRLTLPAGSSRLRPGNEELLGGKAQPVSPNRTFTGGWLNRNQFAAHFTQKETTQQPPRTPRVRAPKPENHFQTLGLRPGATGNQIKARFRQLSAEYHPDSVSRVNDARAKKGESPLTNRQVQNRAAKYKAITQAYDALKG